MITFYGRYQVGSITRRDDIIAASCELKNEKRSTARTPSDLRAKSRRRDDDDGAAAPMLNTIHPI